MSDSGNNNNDGSGSFPGGAMSAEQRAEIRKKLLERQQAARGGSSTPAAPSGATSNDGQSSGQSSGAVEGSGPTFSKETGTTVPPRAASGIPAWQLRDNQTLLNNTGIPGSASNSSTVPEAPKSTEPLREPMVLQAVSFLSSPKVQASPTDRQDSFLKGKGASDGEIAEARRRVSSGAAGGSTAPKPYTGATASSEALAAKLSTQSSAASQAAQAAAQAAAAQAAKEAQEKAMEVFLEAKQKREEGLERKRKQDILLGAILVAGGVLGAAVAFKNIVVSTFFHFANLYQQHLSHKRAQLIAYLTNLQGFLTLYRTPTPLSAEEESRRLKLRLDGKAEEEENTVPKSLERYSAGVEIVIASAQSSISSHLEHIKNRYALDPPLPRYSYGPPPEPAESEVKSDFKDVRRWMDATKRLCESEAYFSATSAYGLGGAGGYWSGSSTSEEKSKSEAAKTLHETITDIKSDLRALKGQLLSRKNFPASVPTFSGSWGAPAVSPAVPALAAPATRPAEASIPSWQQAAASTPAEAGIPSWQQAPAQPQVNGDGSYASPEYAGVSVTELAEEAVRGSLVEAE